MALTEYPKDEAAKWAMAVDEQARKLKDATRSALRLAASSGFTAIPGAAMDAITQAAALAKIEMTKANGKLYSDGVAEISKDDETSQKIEYGLAKLDLEGYRARLENTHEVEKAQDDYRVATERARVDRLKTDVERGQIAIIEERAAIEQEINAWRLIGISAEDDALDAEVDLANEKVRTAQAKLEVIDYLYQVIAAEQLVLAAEQRKATAMEALVAAEGQVVTAKQALIPLHQAKATARITQADAIRHEADVREQIEELGYERITVKQSEQAAEHSIRVMENTFENARLEFVRTERASELAKAQLRNLLLAYQNTVRRGVLTDKAALDRVEKIFRLDQQAELRELELDSEIDYLEVVEALAITEAQRRLAAIAGYTNDRTGYIQETSRRATTHDSVHYLHRWIDKG